MSDNNLVPVGKQRPSFEEFKKLVLQYGADKDFLNRVANLHGKIPRLIRVLHNFDPTGTASAINQLVNKEKSEREQENILRAIYALAMKISKIDEIETSFASTYKPRSRRRHFQANLAC